jgi:oxygen-independent coproporphyrinogen-3 oxidase
MEGIYIHIPFCRQACRYCDFYFTVSLKYMDSFIDAVVEEIRRKGEEAKGKDLGSLYLGGGTPSLLSEVHLGKILKAIYQYNSFLEDSEWTMECNPDDLNSRTLKKLRNFGFNRLSIGVQSFQEKDLELMRRSHGAVQAETSVKDAVWAGFDNISIDLIYGIPGQELARWEENLDKAAGLPITHLSAYHLSFEPGTIFEHWRKQGKLMPVPEDSSIELYHMLRDRMQGEGFDHYELSNLARDGKFSRHNLLYWSGQAYQGFGPSAHSFNGHQRSWNISSLKDYMEGIQAGRSIEQTESLTTKEKYHDYLITSLRTKWGADPVYLEKAFGKAVRLHFENKARALMERGILFTGQGKIIIEPGHWLITDHILRSLFLD